MRLSITSTDKLVYPVGTTARYTMSVIHERLEYGFQKLTLWRGWYLMIGTGRAVLRVYYMLSGPGGSRHDCNMLQQLMMYCNTLQCITAMYCNTATHNIAPEN